MIEYWRQFWKKAENGGILETILGES